MRKNTNLRLVQNEYDNHSNTRKGSKTQRNSNRDIRIENGKAKLNQNTVEVKWAKAVVARTTNQQLLLETIRNSDLTIALGKAGTGKTYLAVAEAVDALETGKVKRIIITRPAVEAGEKLGFLPGDLKEKLDPYMRPIFDALLQRMSPQKMTSLINDRVIEISPIGFMRGRTLSDCAIVVDEGQNATFTQLKMLVTRIGLGSFMIITGDPQQSDLEHGQSGLMTLVDKIEGADERIGIVKMSCEDVVRHPVVKKLVNILEN